MQQAGQPRNLRYYEHLNSLNYYLLFFVSDNQNILLFFFYKKKNGENDAKIRTT